MPSAEMDQIIGVAMKYVGWGLAAFVVFMIALGKFGATVEVSKEPSADSVMADAKAAVHMKLNDSRLREIHYLKSERAFCGQVKHEGSVIGFTPFAYSHRLGLKFSNTWAREEYQRLNELYGCYFLPPAYSSQQTAPFWGGKHEDEIYIP